MMTTMITTITTSTSPEVTFYCVEINELLFFIRSAFLSLSRLDAASLNSLF